MLLRQLTKPDTVGKRPETKKISIFKTPTLEFQKYLYLIHNTLLFQFLIVSYLVFCRSWCRIVIWAWNINHENVIEQKAKSKKQKVRASHTTSNGAVLQVHVSFSNNEFEYIESAYTVLNILSLPELLNIVVRSPYVWYRCWFVELNESNSYCDHYENENLLVLL